MKTTLKLSILYFGLFAFMVVLYIVSPSTQNELVSLFYTATTFLPGIAGIYALRMNGTGNAFGKALLFFTIGLWFWTLAECLWYVFGFILHISPYPSIADFFFLLPYPFFFAGIIGVYESYGANLLNASKKVLMIDASIVSVLAVAVLYFGVYKVYDPEVSDIQNGLSIAYGLADFVLVVGSLFTVSLVREFARSRFGSFWTRVTSGFFCFLVADVLFAIFTSQHESDLKPYTYMDLIWVAGYLLLSFALFEIALYLKQVRSEMTEEISGIVQ